MRVRFYCFPGALGLAIGLLVGACEKEGDDLVADRCADISSHATSCHGHAYEGCGTPCNPECQARGHQAADISDTCGELWLAAYDCVLDLTCEDYLKWEKRRWNDPPDHPCMEPEFEFRAACPDAPLFAGDQ